MREHGILRRALLVYAETAPKLRSNKSSVVPEALQTTAKLFRAFGEDYHEKKLEETYIFPAVKQAGGSASALLDILIVQHNRGREITDSTSFCLTALAEAHVALVMGSAFGAEGYARLSFATALATIEEGFDALESFLKA